MNESPLVSVVILCYNQEATIRRTLDSILNQSCQFGFEVVIGEDASRDNTRVIVEEYAGKYPEKIKLMPKAPNKGILKNYSDCLKASKGKYISTCAGDDWWHNEYKLQLQADFLELNGDFGVVYTNYDAWYPEQELLKERVDADLSRPEGYVYEELLRGNFIVAPTALFRKELLEHVDFEAYHKLGFLMEDYPMWLEFSQHTKFKYIADSTTTYSIANGSICNNSNDVLAAERFELSVLAVKRYFTTNYPVRQISSNELEDVVFLKLLNIGLVNKNRKFAAKYADMHNSVNIKVYLKKIICKSPLLFKLYCILN